MYEEFSAEEDDIKMQSAMDKARIKFWPDDDSVITAFNARLAYFRQTGLGR